MGLILSLGSESMGDYVPRYFRVSGKHDQDQLLQGLL